MRLISQRSFAIAKKLKRNWLKQKLKKQLSDLQTDYHEKVSKLESENDSLKESCQVLCNRCFTLTRGVTCLFCGLDYPCPHMPGLEEQVTMAHELRKGIEKNG